MHGRILRKRNVADLILTETVYSPQARLEKHAHENAYFCAVLQGSYTEHYGRRQLECERRTLLFRPPNEIHQDVFHSAGGRCFIVEIGAQKIERLREHSLKLEEAADFLDNSLSNLILRLNREFHLMDNSSVLSIEGLTLEIMAEATRRANFTERGVPYWLKQAREILQDGFLENPTLEKIALEVKVHPVHLASVFRQKYGCTVGEYIRRLRIEFACREIANRKSISLAEIASASGFSDQSHFTRIFKRETGMTPAAYKKLFSKS